MRQLFRKEYAKEVEDTQLSLEARRARGLSIDRAPSGALPAGGGPAVDRPRPHAGALPAGGGPGRRWRCRRAAHVAAPGCRCDRRHAARSCAADRAPAERVNDRASDRADRAAVLGQLVKKRK